MDHRKNMFVLILRIMCEIFVCLCVVRLSAKAALCSIQVLEISEKSPNRPAVIADGKFSTRFVFLFIIHPYGFLSSLAMPMILLDSFFFISLVVFAFFNFQPPRTENMCLAQYVFTIRSIYCWLLLLWLLSSIRVPYCNICSSCSTGIA